MGNLLTLPDSAKLLSSIAVTCPAAGHRYDLILP